MDAKRIRNTVRRWMFPTEGGSYMGGLENRPVLQHSYGSTVVDTDGKEYLDFQSGQMGAALGHQHPRMVAVIEKTMKTMMHSTNTMLNVPRLRLHERLGKLLPKPLEKSLFLVSGSDSIVVTPTAHALQKTPLSFLFLATPPSMSCSVSRLPQDSQK